MSNQNFRDYDRWYCQGNKLFSEEQYLAAIELYDKALLIQDKSFEALLQKGRCLIQLRKSKDAIPHLKTALDINPKSDRAWYYLGVASHNRGLWYQAVESYTQAVEISPNSPEVWYSLAYTVEKLGEEHQAWIYYHTALKLKPNYSEAIEKQQLIKKKISKYPNLSIDELIVNINTSSSKNIETLKECEEEISNSNIAPDPEYLKSRLFRAYLKKAETLFQLKRYEEAISSFDTAFSLLGRDPFTPMKQIYLYEYKILHHKGVALQYLGKNREAIETYQQLSDCFRIFPNLSLDSFYNQGIAWSDLDCISNALDYFEEVLNRMKFHAAAWYKKGTLLEKTGRINESIKCYQSALEISDAFENEIVFKRSEEALKRIDSNSVV